MANWTSITAADVMTRLSGKEAEAFRNAALAPGEADPMATTIAAVVNRIRGAIAANPRNTLGPDGQIPKCLLDAALDMLAVRVPARAFGTVLDPDGVRKDANRAAQQLLERIEDGKGPQIPGLADDDGAEVTVERPGILVQYYETHDENLSRDLTDGV